MPLFSLSIRLDHGTELGRGWLYTRVTLHAWPLTRDARYVFNFIALSQFFYFSCAVQIYDPTLVIRSLSWESKLCARVIWQVCCANSRLAPDYRGVHGYRFDGSVSAATYRVHRAPSSGTIIIVVCQGTCSQYSSGIAVQSYTFVTVHRSRVDRQS